MSDDVACVDEVELMTDYLEGALPPAQARALERHLDTCPGCTEYLAQMRTLAGGSLAALRDPSLPAGMREQLLAAFRELREDRP
jgi:anti-sigma factor RsiW